MSGRVDDESKESHQGETDYTVLYTVKVYTCRRRK